MSLVEYFRRLLLDRAAREHVSENDAEFVSIPDEGLTTDGTSDMTTEEFIDGEFDAVLYFIAVLAIVLLITNSVTMICCLRYKRKVKLKDCETQTPTPEDRLKEDNSRSAMNMPALMEELRVKNPRKYGSGDHKETVDEHAHVMNIDVNQSPAFMKLAPEDLEMVDNDLYECGVDDSETNPVVYSTPSKTKPDPGSKKIDKSRQKIGDNEGGRNDSGDIGKHERLKVQDSDANLSIDSEASHIYDKEGPPVSKADTKEVVMVDNELYESAGVSDISGQVYSSRSDFENDIHCKNPGTQSINPRNPAKTHLVVSSGKEAPSRFPADDHIYTNSHNKESVGHQQKQAKKGIREVVTKDKGADETSENDKKFNYENVAAISQEDREDTLYLNT